MLDIATFDQRQGGNVLYKALAHPLAAEAMASFLATSRPRLAVFDPDGVAEALFALYPALRPTAGLYVQNVALVGQTIAGLPARPVTQLARSGADTVLIAAFDAEKHCARLPALAPPGAAILSLDRIRLPDALLTNPRRYLDRLNFATNFALFREADGLSTRLTTANYWAEYGAGTVGLWLRLYDAAGAVLAEWQEPVAPGASTITLDSRAIQSRFDLPEFRGQLFLHVIGAAGHDVVKYALDTYAADGPSLSCTHDANAWPSDRYAGLPAPAAGEQVRLWIQNSHASPIPAGALALDRMGAEAPVPIGQDIPGFGSLALDVATLLPDLAWPAQIEFRAGRHVVRPRYEITAAGRTRIAHPNVERADLAPDPAIASLPAELGRGFLLPFPILPRGQFRTEIQPNPMATTQTDLPLRLDLFAPDGSPAGSHFLGRLARDHALALDLDQVLAPTALPDGGHGELVYDFRDGGGADGWLHALFRVTDRSSGHAAETSFGGHIFNTAMTWRDEPQSYSGPPPGLSTRLFLRLGDAARQGFAVLIYPASARWHPVSDTRITLHGPDGQERASHRLAIPCSGSALVDPWTLFGLERAARPEGYVMVRDTTCRLFGYHGLRDRKGGFALDHMFGF